MRKTLLIAAAALAGSVISSQAQVYSQNIVGYVNMPLPSGFNNVANPLDASGGNNAVTNIINVFSSQYDGDLISVWNGASYQLYTIDSTVSTGIADANDVNAVTPPVFNPGEAFFIQNLNASNNITFVGTVHTDGAGASTNAVGLSTNTITLSPASGFYASKVPVGGGLSSVLQFPHDGSLDGSIISIPTITAGAISGFQLITIDSMVSGGYADANDVNPVPEPQIPVGTGFFLQNLTAAPVNWVQSF